MKYRATINANNLELHTDHRTVAMPLPNQGSNGMWQKCGVTYSYGRCRWDVSGMVHLWMWLHNIDDTATPQDVISIRHTKLSVADELRFYAEVNEMGLSHLE